MKKPFSIYRRIEASLLTYETRTRTLFSGMIFLSLIFIIQHYAQYLPESVSFLFFLIGALAFALFIFLILKKTRTSIAILLMILPFYLSPVGSLTKNLPLKNIAFYVSILIITVCLLKIKKYTRKVDADSFVKQVLIFSGILLSVAVSIIFAPVIKMMPISLSAFKEPGSIEYIVALVIMFAICVGTTLVLQIYVNEKKTSELFIDAALAGWVAAVIMGIVGLYFIIMGVGADLYFLTDSYRPTSTFYSVTSASGYIAILLPLAMYRLSNTIERNKIGVSIFLFLICIMAIIVVIATTSRSAFIIIFVILASIFLLFFHKIKVAILAATLIICMVVGGMVWRYPPSNFALYNQEKMPTLEKKGWGDKPIMVQRLHDNNEIRLSLITNSLKLWMKNPIAGIGFGAVSNHKIDGIQLSETHNFAVTIAVEQGIVGLVAHFPLLILIVKLIIKRRRYFRDPLSFNPYAVLMLLGFLIHSLLHLNFYSLWGWAIVGISLRALIAKPQL